MAQQDPLTGQWRTNTGREVGSEGDARRLDKPAGGGGGGGGAGAEGVAAIFLIVFLFVPLLLAKILGFIVGIFLKLGIFGKVVLTALFTLSVFFTLVVVYNSLDFIPDEKTVFGFIVGLILLIIMVGSSLYLGIFWFWRKHHAVIKTIPIGDFSNMVKWSLAIFIYGTVVLSIIIGNVFKTGESMSMIAFAISFIAGIIFYLLKTKNYVPGAYADDGVADGESGELSDTDIIMQSAQNGDAESQFLIGGLYYSGMRGFKENPKKAVEWYRKAAEQGYAEAQNALGSCYSMGNGVREDQAKAVEWHRKAAEQGYAEAQYFLGNYYSDGEGVKEDKAKAVEWYRKAAEQENADAQYKIGYCYFEGVGVTEDRTKACEWFRKAAAQGDDGAQVFIGLAYISGTGGYPKDINKACEWFEKAAAQGNETAKNNLEQIKASQA